jgi:hypothetical protein
VNVRIDERRRQQEPARVDDPVSVYWARALRLEPRDGARIDDDVHDGVDCLARIENMRPPKDEIGWLS